MKVFQQANGRQPTFVVSGIFASGGSIKITITADDYENVFGGELIHCVVSENGKSSASIRTTLGKNGFATGLYDITVLGL
jgi:hypothetical protein